MKIKTELRPADAAGIARGAELLRQGELVALPTETVYGIAADARNGEAVKKIFILHAFPPLPCSVYLVLVKMMGFKPCSLPSVADSVEISPLGFAPKVITKPAGSSPMVSSVANES